MASPLILRSDWQSPSEPISGPAFTPDTIRQVVFHWPGAPAPATASAVAGWLRNAQGVYVRTRGYSIGYGFGFDRWGRRWELRGRTFRCAANAIPGDLGETNRVTIAYLLMIDTADDLTPELIAAVRDQFAADEAAIRRPLAQLAHGDLEPTACPGPEAVALLRSGVFRPPVIAPAPDPEGDPVNTARIVRLPGYLNTFLVGAGPPLHLTPELFDSYRASGVPVVVIAPHDQFTAQVLRQTGLTAADLVPGPA